MLRVTVIDSATPLQWRRLSGWNHETNSSSLLLWRTWHADSSGTGPDQKQWSWIQEGDDYGYWVRVYNCGVKIRSSDFICHLNFTITQLVFLRKRLHSCKITSAPPNHINIIADFQSVRQSMFKCNARAVWKLTCRWAFTANNEFLSAALAFILLGEKITIFFSQCPRLLCFVVFWVSFPVKTIQESTLSCGDCVYMLSICIRIFVLTETSW